VEICFLCYFSRLVKQKFNLFLSTENIVPNQIMHRQYNYVSRPQLDTPLGNPKYYEYAEWNPMRNNSDSFVFFRWPSNINPTQYKVLVETNDTAGHPVRSLGPLSFHPKNVEGYLRLPDVHFGWHNRISVVPITDNNLPSFEAELGRGSTYDIPAVPLAPRSWQMRRHGMSLGF
jgi:hypothetical protein